MLKRTRTPVISYTLLAVCAVDLLATSGDITMTWTSPIYPKLYSNDSSRNPLGKPITSEEDSWIGSLINIGAMLGAFPFGYIAEKFGRKVGLLCVAVPHFIAYVTMAFATHVYYFYFGRFLGGLGVGGGYTLLPMYIAEVAEDSKRGIYSVTLGIFWSIGNFLPYAIGPFLSIKIFNLCIAAIPVIFVTAFSIVGTETPYYLISKNRIEEAEKVLMLLRSADKKDVQVEMVKIQNTLRREKHGGLGDIIKKKGLRKALFISLCLITFQQFGGCNSLAFYLQPIMESSGTKISSDLSSVLIGLCSLAFSALLPFIIERFGRKGLTIFSATGNGFALCLLGAYFYIKESTNLGTSSIFWLPISSIVLGLFMFQIGMSVTPWTISSELFPRNVKQISATAVSSTCWIASFFITKYFNEMNTALTTAGLFWFYGGVNFVCAIFTYVLIPETKGKSLGDIQDMLRKKTSFIVDTLNLSGDEVENGEKVENDKKEIS